MALRNVKKGDILKCKLKDKLHWAIVTDRNYKLIRLKIVKSNHKSFKIGEERIFRNKKVAIVFRNYENLGSEMARVLYGE